jgi:hypothetical protein
MVVMKLKETEMDALLRKIKSFVRHADVDEQRLIFWSLLKETVVKDWDGLEWLYEALRRFVEDEFEGK